MEEVLVEDHKLDYLVVVVDDSQDILLEVEVADYIVLLGEGQDAGIVVVPNNHLQEVEEEVVHNQDVQDDLAAVDVVVVLRLKRDLEQ